MDKYEFNPRSAFLRIRNHWQDWAKSVGATKWVVGISGGKDSTVVAALAMRAFGADNVLGVLMPNGVQTDIGDSISVCAHLGIRYVEINIEKAFESIVNQVKFTFDRTSYDTKTNLPARLRMSTLYAVAQTVGGMVINTCNLSEDVVGYATLWGDNAGSYAPIQGLTVTEIRKLGDWMDLPHHLIHKTPIDGLQPLSDEGKLGFTYEELDRYIREDVGSDEFKAHINELYLKNKFKTDIVRIPGPNFDDLGNFVRYNNLPDVKVAEEEEEEGKAMKEQLEAKKKECNLRQAKCCSNCCHFDYHDEDFGANYSQFCSCPENEDKSAKPGEDAFFEVNDTDVCDNWHGKDANGNPLKDIIHIEAEPRYPEDADVNDEQEDNDNPKMPFLVRQEGTQEGWCWKLDIDIKTGEIIGWPKEVNVRTHYKVCDCCGIKYKEIKYRDYVPEFLSIDGDGYGDYIMITIEDGKIKNWNEDDCREFIRIVRRGDN